jgi:hypothetical protein
MKTRWILAVAALLLATAAFADEVADALGKAQELYAAKKYAEAKAQIEKALAAVSAKARAAIPAPEVKGNTYVNYEFNLRITHPEKDWKADLFKSAGTTASATTPLCQIACVKEDAPTGDVVILYMRDLKAFYGSRYDSTVKGNEKEFLKIAGKQMVSSVRQLTDEKVTGQTELTVGGFPAVRTDYTARKGDKAMKCFTVDILRGPMMFTAIFVGNQANDALVGPAFRGILDSIDLSPVGKE